MFQEQLHKSIFGGLCISLVQLLLWLPLAVHGEPFKVGVIVPLSGPAAANGITIKNSIDLANQDAANEFSNIQFIYEDAQYEASHALTPYRKLRDVDQVDLLYVWGISFCAPIAPLVEQSRVPMVCQGIEHPGYSNSKYVVRFMNRTIDYMQLLSNYIVGRKWHRLAIVLADHPYPESLLSTLKTLIPKEMELTVVDHYPAGHHDMSSTVTKIKHAAFDAIGVFLLPGQIGQFYNQLAKQKVQLPSFGTNYFENHDEIQLGGKQMRGAVYVHNDIDARFAERYEARYGNRSQLAFGGMAYEFARLVGRRLNNFTEHNDPEAVVKSLISVGVQNGTAVSSYRFTETDNRDRYFFFPVALKVVTEKGFRLVN